MIQPDHDNYDESTSSNEWLCGNTSVMPLQTLGGSNVNRYEAYSNATSVKQEYVDPLLFVPLIANQTQGEDLDSDKDPDFPHPENFSPGQVQQDKTVCGDAYSCVPCRWQFNNMGSYLKHLTKPAHNNNSSKEKYKKTEIGKTEANKREERNKQKRPRRRRCRKQRASNKIAEGGLKGR